ncbi:DUF1016 N-terminal domain-containing protein [Emergencia timonensis]|uniref:DUF1016 N-terminal domain-containing protein n=1 Tax=Emergencia timonensis TaxID=1776384 RepID=UPI0039911C43
MVEAYWNNGKSIVEQQGGEEKAEYGASLIAELSKQIKEKVSEEIRKLEPAKIPENIICDPFVLEFLGLSPNDDFYV